MDVSRLKQLGWQSSTSLKNGLKETYSWFKTNTEEIRSNRIYEESFNCKSFFSPELISTGKYNTDLAIQIQKQNCQVKVCVHPLYPDWKPQRAIK